MSRWMIVGTSISWIAPTPGCTSWNSPALPGRWRTCRREKKPQRQFPILNSQCPSDGNWELRIDHWLVRTFRFRGRRARRRVCSDIQHVLGRQFVDDGFHELAPLSFSHAGLHVVELANEVAGRTAGNAGKQAQT